ncbi:MAG TPA: cytochrome c [Acidimicrobiales bacterium]
MTEIPEHLLKRSRERRSSVGLPTEGGDVTAAAPQAGEGAASTPAQAAATPARAPREAAPAAPPPLPPVPPYVEAAQRRKRIPFWAMPVVALLPLYLLVYWNAMKPQETEVVGPLAAGATIYAKCASCHGSNGEGGVGYQFSEGAILKSFDKIADQLNFVYLGNKPFAGKPYGTGLHIGGQLGAPGSMPAWGSTAGGELTDVEILEVICHERVTLGGEDPASDEAASWCTAEGENYLKVVEGGFAAAGVSTAPPG